MPALLALLVVATFSSALGAEFVNLDDDRNFVHNEGFRGLSGALLAWMFTTPHMGHYQPLTWLSFGVDHALWGLSAAHYHATRDGARARGAHLRRAPAAGCLRALLLSLKRGSRTDSVAGRS